METTTPTIPVRSRREAMDWSLVLASQGIEATILNHDQSWALAVEDRDLVRAQASLRQYALENRGWRWKQRLPGSNFLFHWGSLFWVAGQALIYYWTMERFPGLQRVGLMDSAAVRNGQWWRVFTAVTLHADLPHLMANLTTGLVLLGLAMARYGSGVALLAAFLAGAAGNAVALVLAPADHRSLGASGMVMGTLGLIAVHSFSLWHRYRPATKIVLRGLAAAVLLLVLMGFSPGTDVLAHTGGFFAGAVLGLALSCVRPSVWQRPAADGISILLLLGLVFITWRQAIIGP